MNVHILVSALRFVMCVGAYSDKSSPQEHELIRRGECPYVCDVCNKAYNYKSSVRRHQCIHTGERP
jgi:KRAB domain-containing zinc finger protein